MLNDNSAAFALFGSLDTNLKAIEEKSATSIIARGDQIIVRGDQKAVEDTVALLNQLLEWSKKGNSVTINDINYAWQLIKGDSQENLVKIRSEVLLSTNRGKPVRPKTAGQVRYIQSIKNNDMVFAIGPAGTGKTYLAVVMAVRAFKNKEVSRIVLVRPAVEAGEKLGFLPGDIQEKVDPYLRPLFDGLYNVLGTDQTQRYMERNIYEVAPLAYMRGRTLDDSFVILDEAQNTTPEQMKMFLTRLGFGSKAVVTGDITQIDLPKGQSSGLVEVQRVLRDVEGAAFVNLSGDDVIRHPMVQKVIEAYELYEAEQK
ncbi:MAG: PhoH family protein [Syntrophaceticus sp.]|jgi:phosphate starvation-inducible PhoH-like protein|nr:PhoH family protein [Syntrophaceticus sp.]MDD3314890.1 PhoH family protein [Syntrophaceticus sp.]MDD4360284.1 PhoH family protein [Syntrophaceticus sp.]MDD4783232.1 PhoH family protein [Syntrophaceticus sp.]HBG22807.1 phosphate starvation-inducible protein PhoH [Peptococcaceae bacterium]